MSPAIPEAVRQHVRGAAQDRCGYCHSPQHLVLGQLEIEHTIPTARGGSDDEENLWLACRMCNNYKRTQTHAVDPLAGRRVCLFRPARSVVIGTSYGATTARRYLGEPRPDAQLSSPYSSIM